MILLDTNILVRVANNKDPLYKTALQAMADCRKKGETLVISNQTLQEFWVVATRRGSLNGLEMPVRRADAFLGQFLRMFSKLPDAPELFDTWRSLVNEHEIAGVRAYDVRIAAFMRTNRLTRLMALNASDFRHYGFEIIDPRDPSSW